MLSAKGGKLTRKILFIKFQFHQGYLHFLYKMRPLRRFLFVFRRLERQQRKSVTLYLVNLVLGVLLALQLWRKPEFRSVTFAEKYRDDISNAMEEFDFMHKQRIAAKPIPPPEDPDPLPIIEKWCVPRRRFDEKELNESVRRSGILWQSVSSTSTEIYLYSAYYDDRPNAIFPRATGSVQVIGVVWRRLTRNVYCQFWNRDYTPRKAVKALTREIWQRAWDPRDNFYLPILFTCPLTMEEGSPVPAYVSILEEDSCRQKSTPSTLLPIRSHKKKIEVDAGGSQDGKRHTVVCVKGMDFLNDMSSRLVEWLELNYQVGADKVVIYTYSVHPRMRKVIDYYSTSSRGRFEHIPLTLPGHAPNAPLHRSRFIGRNRQQKRRHELVPYNDCLYRHLATHQYVLIVDVDELIVPVQHSNWEEMLNEVKRRANADETWTSFSIANAFFFDNSTNTKNGQRLENNTGLPAYTHILRHDRRSRRISSPGIYGKSFMDTRNVATVFNHFPLHKHKRWPNADLRSTFYVDPNLARKNHYKAECPIESRDECPDLYRYTVRDQSATKYARQVLPRIERALEAMKVEPK